MFIRKVLVSEPFDKLIRKVDLSCVPQGPGGDSRLPLLIKVSGTLWSILVLGSSSLSNDDGGGGVKMILRDEVLVMMVPMKWRNSTVSTV